MNILEQYSDRLIELHQALNSKNCPDDIDQQYQAFYKQYDSLVQNSYKFLEYEGMYVSLHDAHVKDFSERKTLNNYTSSFKVKTFLYSKDKDELGYLHIKLNFNTNEKIRGFDGKEIFDFIIDEQNKQALIVVHNQGKFKPGLSTFIFSFNSATIEHGMVELYEPRTTKKVKP